MEDMRDREPNTASTILTVSGHDDTWQVEANAEGSIIGRDHRCNITIFSEDVSREHARIFQDPFGRWIVEDLRSHNGVYVNGQRIEAQAVLPGDQISIGRYSLVLAEPVDRKLKVQASIRVSTGLFENGLTPKVISEIDKTNRPLSQPYLKQLNEITERLSRLRSFSELYPEVCQCLARSPKMVCPLVRREF